MVCGSIGHHSENEDRTVASVGIHGPKKICRSLYLSLTLSAMCDPTGEWQHKLARMFAEAEAHAYGLFEHILIVMQF